MCSEDQLFLVRINNTDEEESEDGTDLFQNEELMMPFLAVEEDCLLEKESERRDVKFQDPSLAKLKGATPSL